MADEYNQGIVPPPPFPWQQVVANSQPVEEAVEVQVEAAPVEAEEQPKPKYRVVRGSGDPIYLLTPDHKKHWILNAETFTKLGFKFGDEEKIENSELATYIPGEPITLTNWEQYK